MSVRPEPGASSHGRPLRKDQQVQRAQGRVRKSKKGLCVWKVVGEEKGLSRRPERWTKVGIFILISASYLASQTVSWVKSLACLRPLASPKVERLRWEE